SEVGRYTQVTVSDCTPDTTRCFVQRGTNVTITIDFTINRPVKTVTSVVVGEALGAQGEIPFPDSNACTDPHSGISCPLSGNTFRYTKTLPLMRDAPRISGTIFWKLQDENKKNIVCVSIRGKIK
ncbi:hypothetical protein PV326_012693, partial [Microctonus aethiopoides]